MELIGILLWTACLALGFYKLGAQEGEQAIREQAEEQGFGKHYVASDGKKRFRWLSCGEEKR